MITCKELAVKNDGDKVSAFEYDRVYFEFAPTDKVEEKTKTNKKVPVKLNQVAGHEETETGEWKGTEPAEKITSATDPAAVGNLMQSAVNYLADAYGDDKQYEGVDKSVRGLYILLQRASLGENAKVNASVQAENRVAVWDAQKAREKQAKLMVADPSLPKIKTMEQAYARLDKLAALQAQLDAEEVAA